MIHMAEVYNFLILMSMAGIHGSDILTIDSEIPIIVLENETVYIFMRQTG